MLQGLIWRVHVQDPIGGFAAGSFDLDVVCENVFKHTDGDLVLSTNCAHIPIDNVLNTGAVMEPVEIRSSAHTNFKVR